MREIKFRAWDGEIMMYYEPQTTKEYCSNWLEFFFRHCEVMQYTGLKDKRGKEIYEGDIIATGFVVDFADGCFNAFYVNSDGTWDDYEDSLKNILKTEVVTGNIYENPELLEGI